MLPGHPFPGVSVQPGRHREQSESVQSPTFSRVLTHSTLLPSPLPRTDVEREVPSSTEASPSSSRRRRHTTNKRHGKEGDSIRPRSLCHSLHPALHRGPRARPDVTGQGTFPDCCLRPTSSPGPRTDWGGSVPCPPGTTASGPPSHTCRTLGDQNPLCETRRHTRRDGW